MSTVFASLAAIGTYLITMLVLSFVVGMLRVGFPVFNLTQVQPYRTITMFVLLGASTWAAVSVFAAVA